jgi:hypothetical protein
MRVQPQGDAGPGMPNQLADGGLRDTSGLTPGREPVPQHMKDHAAGKPEFTANVTAEDRTCQCSILISQSARVASSLNIHAVGQMDAIRIAVSSFPSRHPNQPEEVTVLALAQR